MGGFGPFEQYRHSDGPECAGLLRRDDAPEAWDNLNLLGSRRSWTRSAGTRSGPAGVQKSFSRETPFEVAVAGSAPEDWKHLVDFWRLRTRTSPQASHWYESQQRLEKGPTLGAALHFMNRTSAGLEFTPWSRLGGGGQRACGPTGG